MYIAFERLQLNHKENYEYAQELEELKKECEEGETNKKSQGVGPVIS